MSANPRNSFNIPAVPEVDQNGGDDLPTYEDLAAQEGPNSRFGRWKGWIEKRAAERYADLTPDVLERRRQRGWGEGVSPGHTAETVHREYIAHASQTQTQSETPQQQQQQHNNAPHLQLRIPTDDTVPPTPPGLNLLPEPPEPEGPAPSIGEDLSPTRLSLHHFGSRFLPHTTSPIRCLLPVLGDSMLLIGHDDGLSVLNMFPKEWAEEGLTERGPGDAEAHHVWTGEGIYQMNLLEAESNGDGTPQGVVLALAGPPGDSTREHEGVRSIRMYNLASLVSLAKWAVVQRPGVLPLRLGSGKHSQGRSKSKPGLTRSLKNLKLDSPAVTTPHPRDRDFHASYPTNLSVPSFGKRPASRSDSAESAPSVDSSWDVVDDLPLPLRWATDYVPLASPGTRLYGTHVLAYDMWRDPNERNRGMAFLAVVVKTNILLYHAPKGERAFRFMKEFYTPITARSLTFIQQAVQDGMSRSPSDVGPRPKAHHPQLLRHSKGMSVGNQHGFGSYPAQLSLFVVFEKKAGIIRINDAAVGEVELYDDGFGSMHHMLSPLAGPSGLSRRSRSSWDGKGFVKDTKPAWVAPFKVVLSEPNPRAALPQSMYILTRGKQSHVPPNPLPANLSLTPPYRIVQWSFAPSQVCARVYRPDDGTPPFIDFVAFGEDGVEAQELNLSCLSQRKGKSREVEPARTLTDVGGAGTGMLVPGGLWHRQPHSDLSPGGGYGDADSDSDLSYEEILDHWHAQRGIYAWVRKGSEDWRVIWLGGTGNGSRCE